MSAPHQAEAFRRCRAARSARKPNGGYQLETKESGASSLTRQAADGQTATMQTIELNGSSWAEPLDFWMALRDALGVVAGHGTGFDAFEDSVFYHPEMLTIRPPFTITVRNAPSFSRKDIEQMAEDWAASDWPVPATTSPVANDATWWKADI